MLVPLLAISHPWDALMRLQQNNGQSNNNDFYKSKQFLPAYLDVQ
jgi:hypothetical protein